MWESENVYRLDRDTLFFSSGQILNYDFFCKHILLKILIKVNLRISPYSKTDQVYDIRENLVYHNIFQFLDGAAVFK